LIENREVANYDCDACGNLVHVLLPDATEIEYVIDGANRRDGKKVGGGTPVLAQSFLHGCGHLNQLAELDGSSLVKSRFV